MAIKYKIKKNDNIIVITGKDKGKTGKVVKILHDAGKAIVSDINMVTKAVKPSKVFPSGGLVKKEMPISLSNISLVDPKTDKPTKCALRIDNDGMKVRYSKKTGEIIKIGM